MLDGSAPGVSPAPGARLGPTTGVEPISVTCGGCCSALATVTTPPAIAARQRAAAAASRTGPRRGIGVS
ncbi:hypothetical protein C1I64_09970 [Rathayibacter festucae DSM 15932]|uniref:Uncharacterized protein n=1 Tax=Rathayibacter festucae DSM 15932 TaxID=1328866 RepID=A0A3T0T1B5_9MICO|nr:hypothetical protein C1I64_09970 [Rathayibacter festucae DSM 15932]